MQVFIQFSFYSFLYFRKSLGKRFEKLVCAANKESVPVQSAPPKSNNCGDIAEKLIFHWVGFPLLQL